MEIARRLRRTDFDPPPTVDSVVLWLARRARPLVHATQRALYGRFVTESFGRRSETIRQCLRGTFTGRQTVRLARDLGFDLAGPPSGLTFDQWLGLFRFLVLDKGAGWADDGYRMLK